MEILKSITGTQYRLEIFADDHCESPRTSQDNACFLKAEQIGGNKLDEEPDTLPKTEDCFTFPIYAERNRSISLSLNASSSLWGGGFGTAICTREQFAMIRIDFTKEKARELVKREIKEYENWINGNCYGFALTELKYCEHCKQTEHVEICKVYGYIADSPEQAMEWILKGEIANETEANIRAAMGDDNE